VTAIEAIFTKERAQVLKEQGLIKIATARCNKIILFAVLFFYY